MKKLLFILITFTVSLFASAQQKKGNLFLTNPNSIHFDTSLFNIDKYFEFSSVEQSKIVRERKNGKILILPLDNMPCLLPNEKTIISMPTVLLKKDFVEEMPNAIK